MSGTREALVAADTINTAALETLAAYRDHGRPVRASMRAIQSGSAVMHRLTQLGIDIRMRSTIPSNRRNREVHRLINRCCTHCKVLALRHGDA